VSTDLSRPETKLVETAPEFDASTDDGDGASRARAAAALDYDDRSFNGDQANHCAQGFRCCSP